MLKCNHCGKITELLTGTKAKGNLCNNCYDSYINLPLKQPAESIAAEADRIINGERREAYGPIEESALDLAAIWTVILRKKLKTALEPREVMLMMVGLKLQRESNSEKRDNRVDGIGYFLLADKLSKK